MSTKQLPALPEATTAEDNDLLLKRDDASGSDQKLSIQTLKDEAFSDFATGTSSVTPTPDTLAKRDAVGRMQAASGGSGNETVVHNDASTSANADTIAKRDASGRLVSASGGSGDEVVVHNDLGALDSLAAGLFNKADSKKVAFTKTANFAIDLSQALQVEVNGNVFEFSQGDSFIMPSLPSGGTDLALWVEPDGTLRASENFTATGDIASGSRQIGGFHYAPGGNASFSLNAGDGGTTPQINEFSFYDLKWKPSVIDPRGLTLVGDGAFWAGIYHLAGDHLAGPPHRHGVNPARGGNPPNLVDGSGNYPDAQPMNIFESLWYHGFRTPRVEDFQLLAFGTNEEASRGSDPGTTGLPGGNTDAQFTSHWGVIQSTGVIQIWSNDSILSTSDETLPNPSRGDRFRVLSFARLGGTSSSGSDSGSRGVTTIDATFSNSQLGGRGIADHVIID